MKRFALITVLFAVFLTVLSGCRVDDVKISDYGEWDKTTKQILADKFEDALPTDSEVSQYGQEYRYAYAQGLLGDPNFVIHVKLKFPDETAFTKHIEEKEFGQSVSAETRNGQCYLIQGTADFIDEYTNDKTYDGFSFDYELILVNEEHREVEYWVAHVWDYWKDEELIGVLQLMQPEK